MPVASTILLAEECDATRAFLADNLAADGYRVLIAPDRAKAIALLTTADPDLILVDVNGATLELVAAIRSGEGLAGRADPDTPLIVLSRDADRLQRIRVRRAQQCGCLGAVGREQHPVAVSGQVVGEERARGVALLGEENG